MAAGDALLKKLEAALRAAPKQAQREVAEALADELESLVQLGFEDSKAPDGSAWAPLKNRDGQPLRLTGRLMGSIAARYSGGALRLGTTTPYAVYHQSEAPRAVIPRRPFLPDEGKVPGPWEPVLEETADEALARAMRKLGAGG